MGILAAGTSLCLGTMQTEVTHLLSGFIWRIFIFALFAVISAILTEVFLPDRDGVLHPKSASR